MTYMQNFLWSCMAQKADTQHVSMCYPNTQRTWTSCLVLEGPVLSQFFALDGCNWRLWPVVLFSYSTWPMTRTGYDWLVSVTTWFWNQSNQFQTRLIQFVITCIVGIGKENNNNNNNPPSILCVERGRGQQLCLLLVVIPACHAHPLPVAGCPSPTPNPVPYPSPICHSSCYRVSVLA